MDPTTTFCSNRNCPARGQTGQGNIGIHARKEQRFICHECHKTFSATTGTVFYRLRTSAETAAGITDHCWTIQELLSFHVPLSRWSPPKQCGRPSHALKRLASDGAGTTVSCRVTGRLARGFKPPAFSRVLFQSAVKSAESF